MVLHSKAQTGQASSIGTLTHAEIFQQPELWPITLDIAGGKTASATQPERSVILTGAGTSAYAADAIAAAWPGAQGMPTTDLLIDSRVDIDGKFPGFGDNGLLVSLARSGDSPESTAVVERIQHLYPKVEHLAITCNANGRLAHMPRVQSIVLDARTNDRSLVMTSSFTNLVLAGLSIRFEAEMLKFLPTIRDDVKRRLPELDYMAERLSSSRPERAVILAGGSLRPLASEAALKILEMTAGRTATLAESFLGLRHGPMSFLAPDTLVLCFLSSSPDRRRYEQDLIGELRQKGLGRIVGIIPETADRALFDEFVLASAGNIRDELRVPFEIPFAQLLAYHLSLRAGLDPDNPSPMGAITRVVQGFAIYRDNPEV